jgi:hypothetical protein
MPLHTPHIDYNYWFNQCQAINSQRNLENAPVVTRHHSVINNCLTKYRRGIFTAYFTKLLNETDVIEEANRLKTLTYVDFENEIISLINTYRNNHLNRNPPNDDLLMQIFDLIQIWGGTPGGGGPYNGPVPTRSNTPINWLNLYRSGVESAMRGELNSYNILRNLTHLRLSFASKHVYFFSKQLNTGSLIIIDIKIAKSFGIFTPNIMRMQEIQELLESVNNIALEYNLQPWQVEKALFTFHSNYFKGKNLKNIGVRPDDYNEVLWQQTFLNVCR